MTIELSERVESEGVRFKGIRGEVEVCAPDEHNYSGDRLEDGVFTIPVRADLDNGEIKAGIFLSHLAPSAIRRGDEDVSREDWMWAYDVIMKALLDFKQELGDTGIDVSEIEMEKPVV